MNEHSFNKEKYEQIIAESIDTVGWHVMKIEEDEYGPSYAYSIGLYKNFQHPEILLIGPEVDIAHFIINIIGEAILQGTQFTPDTFYPSLVEDAYLYFTPVARPYYEDYVAHGQHYYNDPYFPLLQCVYPAPNGAYPGQAKWPKQLNNLQPYLGASPVKENDSPFLLADKKIKLPLPVFD